MSHVWCESCHLWMDHDTHNSRLPTSSHVFLLRFTSSHFSTLLTFQFSLLLLYHSFSLLLTPFHFFLPLFTSTHFSTLLQCVAVFCTSPQWKEVTSTHFPTLLTFQFSPFLLYHSFSHLLTPFHFFSLSFIIPSHSFSLLFTSSHFLSPLLTFHISQLLRTHIFIRGSTPCRLPRSIDIFCQKNHKNRAHCQEKPNNWGRPLIYFFWSLLIVAI